MSYQHIGDFGDFSLSVVVTSPPWYENSYIVRHKPSDEMLVVDPGGDAERILAALRDAGGSVREILLTHGHPDHLGAACAIEGALSIGTRAHADEAPIIAAASDLNRSFTGEAQRGPQALSFFEGEPQLELGGQPIRVIHTPGHTPGGVCYDFGAFVLTGDTLFRQGVGRTDLPGGSEEKLWGAISRLLTLVGEDALLLSGHGPAWKTTDARRWWRLMA